MNHTQYDYDKLFLAYEESRADITAHFRKIMELEREIDKLKKQNEIMREALIEAAQYNNTDDINGEAGYICYKALKDVEGVG